MAVQTATVEPWVGVSGEKKAKLCRKGAKRSWDTLPGKAELDGIKAAHGWTVQKGKKSDRLTFAGPNSTQRDSIFITFTINLDFQPLKDAQSWSENASRTSWAKPEPINTTNTRTRCTEKPGVSGRSWSTWKGHKITKTCPRRQEDKGRGSQRVRERWSSAARWRCDHDTVACDPAACEPVWVGVTWRAQASQAAIILKPLQSLISPPWEQESSLTVKIVLPHGFHSTNCFLCVSFVLLPFSFYYRMFTLTQRVQIRALSFEMTPDADFISEQCVYWESSPGVALFLFDIVRAAGGQRASTRVRQEVGRFRLRCWHSAS